MSFFIETIMKNLFDLRFVIGSFFSVIGILLVLYSLVIVDFMARGTEINRWCGLVFLVFGVVMIWVSLRKGMPVD
jgi:hypothetical protein